MKVLIDFIHHSDIFRIKWTILENDVINCL